MDVPKAKHVTNHLGGIVGERIIAHSSPISVVIDLQSSRVVNSTSDKPHSIYTR